MIKIIGSVEIKIDKRELAKAIFRQLCTEEFLGEDFDDAGCDLLTRGGEGLHGKRAVN